MQKQVSTKMQNKTLIFLRSNFQHQLQFLFIHSNSDKWTNQNNPHALNKTTDYQPSKRACHYHVIESYTDMNDPLHLRTRAGRKHSMDVERTAMKKSEQKSINQKTNISKFITTFSFFYAPKWRFSWFRTISSNGGTNDFQVFSNGDVTILSNNNSILSGSIATKHRRNPSTMNDPSSATWS